MGDFRDPLRWALALVSAGLGPGIILGAVLAALVLTCVVGGRMQRLEAQAQGCGVQAEVTDGE